MYQVLWDDHEGIRHTLAFDSLEDARLEAEALAERYAFVEVVPERSNYDAQTPSL